MTTVNILRLTAPDALYCKYPGQFQPQPCTINLDTRNGNMSCEYNPGNGTTFAHFHQLIRECAIPCLTADNANALMAELVPLAQRVLDGADEEWDGNNHVGVFTEDAKKAWDEIVARCDPEQFGFDDSQTVAGYSVSDWFSEGDEDTITSLELAADTTDDELAAKAAEQVELATNNSGDVGYGVLDHADTYDYLNTLRDQLRNAKREELEDAAEALTEAQTRRDELVRQIKAWGDGRDSLRALGYLARVSHTEVRRILEADTNG